MGELLDTSYGATQHVALHVLPFWGHWKPVVTLAVLIAQLRPDVVLHLLVTGSYYERVLAELKRVAAVRGAPEHVTEAVQVKNIGADPKDWLSKPEGILSALAALPRLRFAIIDMFSGHYCIDALRAQHIPAFFLYPCPVTSFVQYYGPPELGGKGADFDDMQDSDLDSERETNFWIHVDGKVIRVPGMPPVHDYEIWPQEVSREHDEQHAAAFHASFDFLHKSAGTLVLSNSTFDTDAVPAAKAWHAALGKTLHTVGPVSTPEQVDEGAADEVCTFLDRMAEKHGARSVIYISFGTVFWPPQEDRVWALLDTLSETRTPFVFAHNKPISEDKKARYEFRGDAIVRPWVCQSRILAHTAVGWFVTHAGWNSLQEALLHSMPMITWPLTVDQPTNAAVAARTHRIAFELVSVRTGTRGTRMPRHYEVAGKSPEFTIEGVRNEVHGLLARIAGKDGAELRKNAEELGRKMRASVADGGEAQRELSEFLNIHLG